jgi:Tfp pilus assembly protein PilF
LEALGSDLMLLGKFNEALPVQEKVVTLDAKDAQTRVELGFNYLNHQSQPAKAVEVLRQAATIQATAKNLTFLGQALIQAGDLAGAEESLNRALKADPKYAHSYVVLIGLLQKQNRVGDVAQVRAQALQQGVDPKLLPQSAS